MRQNRHNAIAAAVEKLWKRVENHAGISGGFALKPSYGARLIFAGCPQSPVLNQLA